MPGRSKLISFLTTQVPYSQHDLYKKKYKEAETGHNWMCGCLYSQNKNWIVLTTWGPRKKEPGVGSSNGEES